MDDPGLVGGVDGPGQRHHQLGGLPARLRRAGQAVVEAAALEQLQRDERQAVRLADLVDLDDVGMPEPGDRLGLDAEAGQVLGPRLAARRGSSSGRPGGSARAAAPCRRRPCRPRRAARGSRSPGRSANEPGPGLRDPVTPARRTRPRGPVRLVSMSTVSPRSTASSVSSPGATCRPSPDSFVSRRLGPRATPTDSSVGSSPWARHSRMSRPRVS